MMITPPAQWWFGEDQGRYLITVPDAERFNRAVAERIGDDEVARIGFQRVGKVGGDSLLGVTLDQMRQAHESFFADWMDG